MCDIRLISDFFEIKLEGMYDHCSDFFQKDRVTINNEVQNFIKENHKQMFEAIKESDKFKNYIHKLIEVSEFCDSNYELWKSRNVFFN